MDSIDISQLYAEQDAELLKAREMPQYLPGRSIVTSTYRSEIPSTYILLSELRRLDVNVPIEVFYRDGELNDDEVFELSKLHAEVRFKKLNTPLPQFKDRWGHQRGYGTKVLAMYESQYAENLWIDTDNTPIRNCLYLFDDEEYQRKGSMFWRDVYSVDRADQYHSGSDFWKIFRVPYNDAEPFESGQLLINKPVVWAQFSLMLHFTERSSVYYLFGGDAECWRMAWQNHAVATGGYHARHNYHSSSDVPYGMMPYGPFHKGVPNPWGKYGGGTVMVQRDRKGQEMFNHRNLTKWSWTENNPYNDDVINEGNYHMIMNHIKYKYGVTKS